MVLAILPARYASTRLPGKMLADIGGAPLIVRAWQRARLAVDEAVIATDDDRIEAAARAAGACVIRTGGHPNGTSRVAAASRSRPDATVVVNVQGDEPLIDPETVRAVAAAVSPRTPVATAAAPLDEPGNPARVKVVTAHDGRALYFSRQPIPTGGPWRVHVGVYAFDPAVLRDVIPALPASPLEEAEGLEQLRWLQAGLAVQVVPVAPPAPSVDTPDDLVEVRRRWALLSSSVSS